jgi:general secretion pathway protein L
METVAVRWNVELETWFVSPLSSANSTPNNNNKPTWQSFDEWAAKQADLSQLRFILQGENYVCRWITLPGVQGRHLPKALPFALEESLIEDIRSYHIVTTGKHGKFNHRVYCNQSDPLKRLLEACEHRNITLRQLIPETSLIPENTLIRNGDYWLINIPGLTEAKVHESALLGFLDGICNNQTEGSLESLKLIDTSLDSGNLLKTQIESSFSGVFQSIHVQIGTFSELRDNLLESKCVNLLTNEFRPEEVQIESPSAWWKPVAVLAACWCVFLFTQVSIENRQLIADEERVKSETIALYKQFFPGERIRFLERQIRSKVKGDVSQATTGVIVLLSQASKALQQNNLKQMIDWQSFRFNDRQNELIIDLTSKSLAQLQEYKSALEKQGLIVEISQATNSEKGVKGRLKIGAAA